jgi:hypothetical protein
MNSAGQSWGIGKDIRAMEIDAAALIGPALDWAVEKALGTFWSSNGYFCHAKGVRWRYESVPRHHYSSEWSQGGPIIEREGIEISPLLGMGDREPFRGWFAGRSIDSMDLYSHEAEGPTPLIAAMRCFVTAKLGAKIDVPAALAA